MSEFDLLNQIGCKFLGIPDCDVINDLDHIEEIIKILGKAVITHSRDGMFFITIHSKQDSVSDSGRRLGVALLRALNKHIAMMKDSP